MENECSLSVHSYIAVRVDEEPQPLIGMVICTEPLTVALEDEGYYAAVASERIEILWQETRVLQCNDALHVSELLREALENNNPFLSGLSSLGVLDGTMHAILPNGPTVN